MGATLVLAWRNIWRNTRRTLITAAAIGVGLAALIVTIGLTEGMRVHLVDVSTGALIGDAQIHATGWLQVRDETLTLPDPERLLTATLAAPAVRAVAPRVRGTALLAIGDRSAAVQLIGVDPTAEQAITTWATSLSTGAYLSGDDEVLIGRTLAKDLDVEVGTRLALTAADVHTGDMNGAMVRVAGILYTASPTIDERAVIVTLPQSQRLLGLPGAIHEIAMRLTLPPGGPEELVQAALAPLDADGLEVTSWRAVSPLAAQLMELQDVYLIFIGLIVFSIIALGIMNTLSMSLLERFHEFGVLRAIGTTPLRLATLVLTEAASLGVVGAAMGVGLGLLVHWPLTRTGLKLTETNFGDVSFATRIIPVLDVGWVVGSAVVFVALTTLVALIVAIRAARIQPAAALRQI